MPETYEHPIQKQCQHAFNDMRGKGLRVDLSKLEGYKKTHPERVKNLAKSVYMGRINPRYKVSPKNGRAMTSVPCIHNLAKEQRDVIIPDEGCEFWSFDAQNYQIRILASLSGDAHLASLLKGDVYEALKDALNVRHRSRAKQAVIAYIFGASPAKINQIMKRKMHFAQFWNTRFPKSAQFLSKMHKLYEAGKSKFEAPDETILSVEAKSPGSFAAIVIQKVAALAMMHALHALHEVLQNNVYDGIDIALFLHDQVVLQVNNNVDKDKLAVLPQIMNKTIQLFLRNEGVDFPFTLDKGSHWS